MTKNFFSILIMAFFLCQEKTILAQQSPHETAKKIVEQKDLDGDGTLCFMECPAELSYDFKKIDTNSDSFLTIEEISAHLKSTEAEKKK